MKLCFSRGDVGVHGLVEQRALFGIELLALLAELQAPELGDLQGDYLDSGAIIRWGRRIPVLFWVTPFVTLFLALTPFSPEIAAFLGAGREFNHQFRIVRPDGEVVVNEINTIPGFTSISMFPKMWEHSGIPYSALLDRTKGLTVVTVTDNEEIRADTGVAVSQRPRLGERHGLRLRLPAALTRAARPRGAAPRSAPARTRC